MTVETRASHTIPKIDLNKSLFDNYSISAQDPPGITGGFDKNLSLIKSSKTIYEENNKNFY